MINPAYEEMYSIGKSLEVVIKKHFPKEHERLISKLNAKLKEDALTVQLYGAYNAGKSSFVNMLLCEDIALVGDKPLTDKIEDYFWNGIRLLDSPGVNAPIEHETITEESLKSVDLIIFIIRYGDHDSKIIYEKLVELLKANKQIFLILNYEGLDPLSIEQNGTAFMAGYIGSVIQEYINIYDEKLYLDLIKNLNIIPLNIKSAHKALRENKELLLERSGYNEFEFTFNNWINERNNEEQLLDGAKRFIFNQIIEPLLNSIDQNSVSVKHQEQKSILLKIKNEKSRVLTTAGNQVRLIASEQQQILHSGFESIDSEVQVKNVIEKYFTSCSQNLSDWLEDELRNKVAIEILDPRSSGEFSTVNKDGNNVFQAAVNLGSSYLKNNPLVVKKIFTTSLKTLKKNLPGLMKGVGPKSIDKIANKAVPVIGLLLLGYDVYKANKDEESANQAERNRVAQKLMLINNIKAEFINNAKQQVEVVIEDFFEASLKDCQSLIDELNNNEIIETTERDFLLETQIRINQLK